MTRVEERAEHRLIFSVRAYTGEGRIEFPIGIQDQGNPARDEVAVLRATLNLADELTASLRLRLSQQTPTP
jgi:hypothetical protein